MISAADFLKWCEVFGVTTGGGGSGSSLLLLAGSSQNIDQIFSSNPASSLSATDLNYIGRGPIDFAGEWGVLSGRYTAIYVNNTGSDTAGIGNGSLLCPYKTVNGAMTAITDASITKPYVIHMTGAITDTTAVLKPFIHIFSDGSPWYVSAVNLATSFQTADNFWMKYQNISLASDCTLILTFTDVSSHFGYLEFINCNTTKVDTNATPVINFIVNSPSLGHHHIFTDCNFSEFNDNGRTSFSGVASGQALLSITGGTLPVVIDFTQAFVQGTIQIANTNINACIIKAGGAGCTLYLSSINVNNFNHPSIISTSSNSFIYDSSIANTSIFDLIGDLGSTFQLLTEGSVIFPNYSPNRYNVPNPGIFQNTKNLYDHLNGIDLQFPTTTTSAGNVVIPNTVGTIPAPKRTWYLTGASNFTVAMPTAPLDGEEFEFFNDESSSSATTISLPNGIQLSGCLFTGNTTILTVPPVPNVAICQYVNVTTGTTIFNISQTAVGQHLTLKYSSTLGGYYIGANFGYTI